MNFQELKAIGLKNQKGRIVDTLAAYVASPDVKNHGNWNPEIDIYEDMIAAIQRLTSRPSYITGSHKTLNNFCIGVDPFGEKSYQSLFERLFNSDGDWIRFDDTADLGIVLLVGTKGDVVYIDTR